MPVPVFAAGRLAASALNAAFAYVPQGVIKSADETIISNATYQNDDELAYPVETGTTYGYRLGTIHTSGATPDIKFQLTAPAGATFNRGISQRYDTAGSFGFGTFTGGVIGAVFGSTSLPTLAEGTVVIGGTAGTLRLQWAQNTSDATNTTVEAGSFLQVWKV